MITELKLILVDICGKDAIRNSTKPTITVATRPCIDTPNSWSCLLATSVATANHS